HDGRGEEPRRRGNRGEGAEDDVEEAAPHRRPPAIQLEPSLAVIWLEVLEGAGRARRVGANSGAAAWADHGGGRKLEGHPADAPVELELPEHGREVQQPVEGRERVVDVARLRQLCARDSAAGDV